MLIKCPAKINIGLQIKNKRIDGFHNIRTIFHKICLKDELILESSHKFEFIFNAEVNLSQEDNIAYKAAMGIKRIYNLEELHVKLTINKQIAFGGGLAGGSTNAAGVIRGLPTFLQLPVNHRLINELALSLGSDVPFLVHNADTALAGGRGENIEPIEINLTHPILLVFPGISISTADAYMLLKRTDDFKHPKEDIDYISAIRHCAENPEDYCRYFENDFEKPIFDKYPELEAIKVSLLQQGAAYAQMSGSGSTIFAIFKNITTARQAQEVLTKYKTHLCITEKPL